MKMKWLLQVINLDCLSLFSHLDAPKVLMPATTPGYYLQRGAVRCHVESLIPFTLRFTRDGGRLGVDQLFRWAAAETSGPKSCISWLNTCCWVEFISVCQFHMTYFHQNVNYATRWEPGERSVFMTLPEPWHEVHLVKSQPPCLSSMRPIRAACVQQLPGFALLLPYRISEDKCVRAVNELRRCTVLSDWADDERFALFSLSPETSLMTWQAAITCWDTMSIVPSPITNGFTFHASLFINFQEMLYLSSRQRDKDNG